MKVKIYKENIKIVEKISNIAVPIYLVICIIVNTFKFINEENIVLDSTNPINTVLFVLFVILISIIVSIINNAIILAFYIGVKIASKKFTKEKFDETDLKKYQDYYRELIKNYNIGTLDYIDDFKIDYKYAYPSKLLELQNKKILEINNDEIRIINTSVDEEDKLFVDSIVDNKITLKESEYKNKIIEICKKRNLIEIGKFQLKKVIILFLIIIGLSIVSFYALWFIGMFGGESIFNNDISKIILIIIVLLFALFIPGIIFFFVTYITTYTFKSISDPYVRTSEGKEINKKLEGLKNFLNDFSNINDKTKEELVLWENYLIYSVMFNQNKNIINEYQKYLDSTSIEETD